MDNAQVFSKSVGPNSITIRLLKVLNSGISNQLAMIINESFSSGIFPDKLKIAKVTPIFKKGLRSERTIDPYLFYLSLVKYLKN